MSERPYLLEGQKFQKSRMDASYTQESASNDLNEISLDRIKRIESGSHKIRPSEVCAMADLYHDPTLYNFYCTNVCEIGKKYIPKIETGELQKIVLKMLSSLNSIENTKNRLVDIAVDGEISDEEIDDFVRIQKQLNEISITVEALKLWVDKEIKDGKINMDKYNKSKEKIGL
nr:XRE family transcriptional regulator [uncultured Ruminococcus sp.]